MRNCLTVLTLTLAATAAFAAAPNATCAQEAPTKLPPKTPPPERANSININPLGAIFGSYTLNYERLFLNTHGLIIEGVFATSSNDDSNSTTFGGSAGYRWHWSGEQDSGFLGAMVGYQQGSGDATVETTVNGQTTKETFQVDTNVFHVTANIGRRWAWDSGVNITFRFGAGYGDWKVSTDDTSANAQDAVKLVDDLLNLLPVYLDGELSLGYTF